MDNKKVLPNSLKNDEARQTQVFVLPPELLKGLLLQNKIPKINDPKKLVSVIASKPINIEEQEKKVDQSSNNLDTINNETNKIEKKNDETVKKSVEKLLANEAKQIETKSPVSKKKNQKSIKKVKKSAIDVDLTKQLKCSDESKSVQENIDSVKKTSDRRRKITKISKNIVETCMQTENPNLEITNESLILRSRGRISKNSKEYKIANAVEPESVVIDKQEIESSSKHESFLDNNVMLVSNESNSTESNQASCSQQKRIIKIAKPCVNNTSNDNDKTVNNVVGDADDLSTQSCIKPINEENNVELKLEKEQVNIDKNEKFNFEVPERSTNIIHENQARLSRRKRIPRIPNISGILKTSTGKQELDGKEKVDVGTINLPAENSLESPIAITDTSLSDNLTCLKSDKPSGVIHQTVQNNETITTNTMLDKEKININTTCVEAEQRILEKDEFSKSMDMNPTRYSKRKRISEISDPKKVVNAVNDESKTDTESSNQDSKLLINKLPQKNCSNTIIEKYKKLCTEKMVDENSTLKVDSDKTNILQSSTDIANFNFNMFDKSSINENQTRHSRRRRISKVPNLTKVDKVSNDKSKTTDKSKKETNINDIPVQNSIESQAEETTIALSKEIVCSNGSTEVKNKIIHDSLPIMTNSSIETSEVTLDEAPVESIISNLKFPNELSDLEVVEPIRNSTRISETSKQDKCDDFSKNLDKQETLNQYKNCSLLENDISKSNESNKASTSEIQYEPSNSTVSQSKYPRRKRIARVPKPSIITNTRKNKQSATNNIENETQIINQQTVNDIDTKIVEKSSLESVTSLESNEYGENNSNIVQSATVLSSDPNFQTDCTKIDSTSSRTDTTITINNQSTESCIDMEMVEKPISENIAFLDSNELGEVNSNIVQSITELSSNTNFQTERAKTDRVCQKNDITINDLPTENCIDTEASLKDIDSLDLNKYDNIKKNVLQSIGELPSSSNIVKENSKSDTVPENIEESNFEISNKSLDATNEELIMASDKLTHTFDQNIIVEQILEQKDKSTNVSEIPNDQSLFNLSNSVKHENCQENIAFENECEEIEIIEEIEYIIEEVLEEECTEPSNDIIVYDTMDSVDSELEKSPIKNNPLVPSYENDRVGNLNHSINTEVNDINENVSTEQESPIKILPNNSVDSELSNSNKNILNQKETPIKNLPLVTSSENIEVTSPNTSIDLELNSSNEIVLVKKENEKVNVYVNKRKIQSETLSNENHESQNSSIEVKNTHVMNLGESEESIAKFTDPSSHDTLVPILTTRRYSARSCKRNSITAQEEQKKEPKARNRSKSTNQVNNNKSNAIGMRTRNASVTINSNSLKECKNEDGKMPKESSVPSKAFKQGKTQKNVSRNTQALVEDGTVTTTRTKNRRGKAIHMIKQKPEENNIAEDKKEMHHNDSKNVSHENHTEKLGISSIGSSVVTNEAEINLSYINDEEDVTIDLKEILDSIAIADNQDEDDSLLFFQNNKIGDEETKLIEENLNKDNHIETICNYNFSTTTDKVHTEGFQLKESNKSHNDEIEKVIQSKVDLKNDPTIQHWKKTINDTDTNASKIDNSIIQNAKQTNFNNSSEEKKNEMISEELSEITKEIFDTIENPKPINIEFNANLCKLTDNNKLSLHIASASIFDSKDKLDYVSKISETNNSPKSQESIKIETYSKFNTEQKFAENKESDNDSVDDNYESVNIAFENYDCSSISSPDDSSEITNEGTLSVKNSSDLEKTNASQNKVEDDEFSFQEKIEKSQSCTENQPNEAIISNVQIEQLGLVTPTYNQEKNLGIKDSKVVKLTSLWKTNNQSLKSPNNNNADSQLKLITSPENVLFSRETKKDIKRTLKQTSLDSFIVKKTKESTSKLFSTTEKISEKITETSSDLTSKSDVSFGRMEITHQDSTTKIPVLEDDNNSKEVYKNTIVLTEEANIKSDNSQIHTQEKFTQINTSTACISEKVETITCLDLKSDNNARSLKEEDKKFSSEKLGIVVSVDKVKHKNNLLLESDSAIENTMMISEKSSIVIQANMACAKIKDKNEEIKDEPSISPITSKKNRIGRPPKSAKKVIEEKTVADDIPTTGKNLLEGDNAHDEEKSFEMKGRKKRSCRLSLLQEPRRSTRHKTDDNSKEVLNSSIKQRRPNRRSTKDVVESQISEENTDISVNNEDQNTNKLISENTENQVKKRKGRQRKSKLDKSTIFIDQEKHTVMKNDDEGDSSITLKTFEQPSQSTCLVLNTEDITNEIDAKSTNCNTSAEININDSTVLTENNATDTVLNVTRKRKRSTTNVIVQEDDEIVSEKDSIADHNTTAIEEENDEKETSDDSDADEIVIPVKRRKGSLGPYRKRRKGKTRRGRPRGVQRKSVCDNDYVPHHSHLNRTPKKETPKIDSFAELSMKKIVTCGKCDVEIVKSQWAHHNLMTHNNTGWLKGSAKPDYENDEKLFRKVINLAHKKRKKTLVCEQCKVIKRSVAGYLSHLTFCGKSEEEMQALMVTCPVCKAVTKPSSVEYHERMHRLEAEAKERMPEIDAENIDFGPRGKRKAAEKAVSKISEFTALVKEDKENSGPSDKKLKMNANLKKVIQKPQLEKRIPSTSINKWRKDLASGQNATCSQIGCQFTSNSFDEIKTHYSTCNFTPRENYLCKICRFQSSTHKEIVDHALEKHSVDDEDANLSLSDAESSSSDNSSDNEDVNKSQPQAVMRKFYYKESSEISNKLFKFIFKDGTCHTKFNKTYFGSFQWTLEFERKHYKLSLFEEYAPNNFELLNSREACSYLPEVEQSMPMMIIKTGDNNEIQPEWKTWKRFEGQCCGDNPTFFVGGPVWALAWLPIPTWLTLSEKLSQFIAVSTHPTMDATYSVGESYSGKNIIQIWDVGNLDHKSISQYTPKLAYAIAHEGGTVWCLEWCPSGCYQHEDLPGCIENNTPNKMGLLAAGCTDGCVRIYSLVFPEDITKENSENIENSDKYPIYNTEPALILVVNKDMYDNKKQNWQVTKLSWSKEKNHNIIAAGFSNGYVALWNLALKSPLLKSKKGNTVYLHPYRHFFAHHHAISMVHLIPQDNKRFLATASLDRLYKLWDLEDVTNPKNSFKKSFVTDGAWLNHWCLAFVTYDDALSMGHNYSYCLPLRDYTYKYFNIFPTNSPSFSISTSDYGNSIANGTLAGEILAIFPQQLIYIRDMEKTLPRKRFISMISTAELVDFQKLKEEDKEKDKVSSRSNKDQKDDKAPYDFMPTTYKDSKDRFGIKFYDNLDVFRDQCMIKPKNHKKTLTIEMMKNTPVEQYPFMSVNRLSWNPNASSFLWLAAGYQNGFVRLMSFKSMASPAEWSKLLASHIETLKSDCTESQSTKLDDR
ncbi:hypothetical protein TSAR_004178 [Trichomalopsis sarcophagae]|uniref:C2H2-type domain-containing protein n=1 Tax=Trichomalopsis sarcophagae TaxID=543379 RepID=A0A232FI08_9HYME|nr:hypothetical protein TSAR_004178 [Trichomalopsis sarcophagae]